MFGHRMRLEVAKGPSAFSATVPVSVFRAQGCREIRRWPSHSSRTSPQSRAHEITHLSGSFIPPPPGRPRIVIPSIGVRPASGKPIVEHPSTLARCSTSPAALAEGSLFIMLSACKRSHRNGAGSDPSTELRSRASRRFSSTHPGLSDLPSSELPETNSAQFGTRTNALHTKTIFSPACPERKMLLGSSKPRTKRYRLRRCRNASKAFTGSGWLVKALACARPESTRCLP